MSQYSRTVLLYSVISTFDLSIEIFKYIASPRPDNELQSYGMSKSSMQIDRLVKLELKKWSRDSMLTFLTPLNFTKKKWKKMILT